jgi:hypothetical protein
VFRSTEPVHTSASFICKNHPRTEQARASGREYDKNNDHADAEVHFQSSQFDRASSLKIGFLHEVEDGKANRRKHSGHTNEKAEKEHLVKLCHLCASSLDREIETDDWCGYEIRIHEIIAGALLNRKKEFVSAIGKNPDDEFEIALLRTLRGQLPDNMIVGVDAAKDCADEYAAWGRPDIYADDGRSGKGVDVDPNTKKPLVPRKVVKSRKPFEREPERLYVPRRDDSDFRVYKEVFETSTETRVGTSLPRRKAYDATRTMIFFGRLARGNKRDKEEERRFHTCLEIEFMNLNIKDGADRCEISERQMKRELEEWRDMVKDYIKGGFMFNLSKIPRADLLRILNEGGVYAVLPRSNPAPYEPYAVYEVHKLPVAPGDSGLLKATIDVAPAFDPARVTGVEADDEVLPSSGVFMAGLRESQLLADLKDVLMADVISEKSSQARLKRSKKALDEAITAERERIDGQIAEATIEDFGPAGELECRIKTLLAKEVRIE